MHNLLEYIGLSSYRESFNHYGIITFNNYLSIIQKKIERQKLEEEIIQAFEFFDKDKKGYFDIDFFKSLMLSLREKLTLEPSNLQYRQFQQHLEYGGTWYSDMGRNYDRPYSGMGSMCLSLLCLQAMCGPCCCL